MPTEVEYNTMSKEEQKLYEKNHAQSNEEMIGTKADLTQWDLSKKMAQIEDVKQISRDILNNHTKVKKIITIVEDDNGEYVINNSSAFKKGSSGLIWEDVISHRLERKGLFYKHESNLPGDIICLVKHPVFGYREIPLEIKTIIKYTDKGGTGKNVLTKSGSLLSGIMKKPGYEFTTFIIFLKEIDESGKNYKDEAVECFIEPLYKIVGNSGNLSITRNGEITLRGFLDKSNPHLTPKGFIQAVYNNADKMTQQKGKYSRAARIREDLEKRFPEYFEGFTLGDKPECTYENKLYNFLIEKDYPYKRDGFSFYNMIDIIDFLQKDRTLVECAKYIKNAINPSRSSSVPFRKFMISYLEYSNRQPELVEKLNHLSGFEIVSEYEPWYESRFSTKSKNDNCISIKRFLVTECGDINPELIPLSKETMDMALTSMFDEIELPDKNSHFSRLRNGFRHFYQGYPIFDELIQEDRFQNITTYQALSERNKDRNLRGFLSDEGNRGVITTKFNSKHKREWDERIASVNTSCKTARRLQNGRISEAVISS